MSVYPICIQPSPPSSSCHHDELMPKEQSRPLWENPYIYMMRAGGGGQVLRSVVRVVWWGVRYRDTVLAAIRAGDGRVPVSVLSLVPALQVGPRYFVVTGTPPCPVGYSGARCPFEPRFGPSEKRLEDRPKVHTRSVSGAPR